MTNPLRKLEVELENLFEKTTGVFSMRTVQAGKILALLVQALEEHAHEGPGGRWIAPHRFTIFLGTQLWARVSAVPELPTLLAAEVENHIRRSEMILSAPMEIRLESDRLLREDGIRVEAEAETDSGEATDAYPAESRNPISLPPGAFFIINGGRHFPLNRPVVNIGRALENQLVLEDPLVSRQHAQLRARDGQYLLTDLGSKHGLRVNNSAVREWVLQPGDVLHFANTELIYSDDREESITQPIPTEPPASGSEPEIIA